jgi:hypothetical protein
MFKAGGIDHTSCERTEKQALGGIEGLQGEVTVDRKKQLLLHLK